MTQSHAPGVKETAYFMTAVMTMLIFGYLLFITNKIYKIMSDVCSKRRPPSIGRNEAAIEGSRSSNLNQMNISTSNNDK